MHDFIASQKDVNLGTTDWPGSFIVGVLHSKGVTLASLAKNHGLGRRTLSNAFVRPYPKAERIIAEAVGCEPRAIWPSRYHSAKV